MINKLKIIGIVLALITIVSVLWGQIGGKQPTLIGSAVDGQTHNATSTRNFAGTALTNFTLIKGGAGTLGSVVITGANTGEVRFYDATTTNVSARTGNIATSSLPTYILPASLAAGTYVFDVNLNTGLVYELVSGLAPTSTITYR